MGDWEVHAELLTQPGESIACGYDTEAEAMAAARRISQDQDVIIYRRLPAWAQKTTREQDGWTVWRFLPKTT